MDKERLVLRWKHLRREGWMNNDHVTFHSYLFISIYILGGEGDVKRCHQITLDTHTHTRAYTFTHKYAHTYTRICTYIHVYLHIYVHI